MPDAPHEPDEAGALRAAIEARDAETAALREQAEALSAQVAELRARLRQNPRNSSKPPSSEGLGKPPQRPLRKKSGRKPGRPKRQPGATLEMTDRPDEVLTHEPGQRSGCGTGSFGAEVTGTERRQVAGLPEEIRAEVTGHRMVPRRCSCGTVTSGAAPEWVTAPVRHGPRITAAAVYLRHGQFLSRDRTCQAGQRAVRRPGVPGRGDGHGPPGRREAGRPAGRDPQGPGHR